MKKNILILNGPNLNLLGKREPAVYGTESFTSFFERLRKDFPMANLSYYQSNIEGELINKLQEVGFNHDGIVLNAGGYTHTSVALADAVAAISTPVIEIHISNVFARESFRRHSYLSPVCIGSIVGFGLEGYRLGIKYLLGME